MTNLPTFFIFGATKSGTSSLYFYLKQHPDVFMSGVKEPRFSQALAGMTTQAQMARIGAALAPPMAAPPSTRSE